MINRYSSVPLYKQLVDLLLQKINSQEYSPGDKIPSEQELCEKYDISRPTVRQAIKELVQGEVLEKIKGKGTFVKKDVEKLSFDNLSGFEFSVLESDDIYNKNIIDIVKELDVKDEIKDVFKSMTDEFCKVCIMITNQKDKESELFGYVCSYISLQYFPNIVDDLKNKKPSYEILKSKYPYLPFKSKNKIELQFSTQVDSKILKIPQNKPVLKQISKLYSRSGNVVEYIEATYIAENVSLNFEKIK